MTRKTFSFNGDSVKKRIKNKTYKKTKNIMTKGVKRQIIY